MPKNTIISIIRNDEVVGIHNHEFLPREGDYIQLEILGERRVNKVVFRRPKVGMVQAWTGANIQGETYPIYIYVD